MTRASLLVLVACGGGPSAVPSGAQVGPALTAALASAELVRAPWRCAANDGPVLADETLEIGTRTWKLGGHAMQRTGKGVAVIGAVADAGGASPSTVAALGRLRTKLAKADVVLALGGMGTTQPELESTLGALADGAPFAVVAFPGDLESASALAGAIKAMRARGQVVIDGRLVQRLELGTTTVGAIAGAGFRTRLVAGDDGCTYRETDVITMMQALSARPGVRILATTEAPRSTYGGEPTGELALTAGAGTEIDVALHAPTVEAASRARTGSRDGDAVALTPGTADATPRLPGPARAPTAGVLTVHGDSWAWKPIADAE